MPYTVGETAKKIGVAPSTVRYYDKEGLLPFVGRSSGGVRLFKDEDMEWLSIIECLKKTGMPIKEIKKFIDRCVEGDSTISERLEIIKRQKAAVLEQIEKLKETLSVLEYKQWYYETAKEKGTCKDMDKEKVPEKFRGVVAQMRGN